ncbi:hypothetical protein H5410_005906 [Solanum commersonii]|uniref:Uncharacterized protein n=1 Tax=Solanum commersonii TaxID=4109 RepID=A0A9J6A8E3_SOLCO|nr:hypothetical protein H5410_005906 [Solanum commersonii]
MASVVGRPIATDKATQDKTMPRVKTLLLSAKDGVTSDSVVPVINLESNLASNPKLPTTGVYLGKILFWSRLKILDKLIRTMIRDDGLKYQSKCLLQINSDQELHALSTPILQVSNPETTRIIKESYTAMLNKKTQWSNHIWQQSTPKIMMFLILHHWSCLESKYLDNSQSPKGMTRVWGRKQVILDGQI